MEDTEPMEKPMISFGVKVCSDGETDPCYIGEGGNTGMQLVFFPQAADGRINGPHLDGAVVGGREQGATSEPRGDYFLLAAEAGESCEAAGDAQDASDTHHVQNRHIW